MTDGIPRPACLGLVLVPRPSAQIERHNEGDDVSETIKCDADCLSLVFSLRYPFAASYSQEQISTLLKPLTFCLVQIVRRLGFLRGQIALTF